MPRFVLLEHSGAPDDPAGLHYDLLLEQGPSCRTWRLAGIPQPGGPDAVAVALPAHRLAWLDHEAGEVSGGRGFARRIDKGTYDPSSTKPEEFDPAAAVVVTLQGNRIAGELVLRRAAEHWLASLSPAEANAETGRGAEPPGGLTAGRLSLPAPNPTP
jgi:hypothetical protein